MNKTFEVNIWWKNGEQNYYKNLGKEKGGNSWSKRRSILDPTVPTPPTTSVEGSVLGPHRGPPPFNACSRRGLAGLLAHSLRAPTRGGHQARPTARRVLRRGELAGRPVGYCVLRREELDRLLAACRSPTTYGSQRLREDRVARKWPSGAKW
jgi:hypothetical protein